MNGLAIDACDAARGLRAAVDIAPGTEVARIPPSLFITVDVAKASRIGARLAATSRDISGLAFIATFLLETRRDGGFWSPYVDMLPRSFPEHVLSFGPLELLAVHVQSAVGCVLQAVRRLHRRDFESVADVLADEGFDAADFEWAWCCVRTRGYRTCFDDQPGTTLIPLADLRNHVNRPATDGLLPDRADYVISANRALTDGEEATASYGELGNAALLSGYGFVLDDNEFDSALLPICGTVVMVSRGYATDAVRDMFSHVRRSLASAAGIDSPSPSPSPSSSPSASIDGSVPFGIDHETACLLAIHDAFQAALVPFDRCLGADDMARARVGGGAGLRTLMTAIESEKKVLLHFLLLTDTARRVLGSQGASAEDKALLSCIDPEYAAEVWKLIDERGGTS